MNRISLLALAALPLLSGGGWASELRIVTTTPELADLVKRVGGARIKVESLARGPEDIHQIVMRPSFVAKLNRADAAVMMGLTLEHSFLPGLLDVAANPKIRPSPEGCSGPGCIDCSNGVRVLDKPETLSRAEGDLHPLGNPHYNLDPENATIMARNVQEGLARLDPGNAADYEKNLKAFDREAQKTLAELRALAAPLKGLKAVSYHKDVAYLARFTGLDFVDTVELKPGVSATPTHLAALARKMKQEGVKIIVREQQYDAKICEWLAAQTGARVAVIGGMANSLPETETLFKLAERNIRAIRAAAGKDAS